MKTQKGKRFARPVGAVLTGGLAYYLLLTSTISGTSFAAGALITEVIRGTATLLFGPLVSVGMFFGDMAAFIQYPCEQLTLAQRIFTIIPHLIPGWLWWKYSWKGGIFSCLLCVSWYWSMATPQLRYLSTMGYIAACIYILGYYVLRIDFHQEKAHAV